MDSGGTPRTRRRIRGRGSVSRRADAFRLRIAAKHPTRRELMDAKYMGNGMDRAVALTDYLGKFCTHLPLKELKSLTCLAIEDPTHPSLLKYWGLIEERDLSLGDSSDDDVHDIVTCAVVTGAKLLSNESAVPKTPIVKDNSINVGLSNRVNNHASCVLTEENGILFENFMRDEYGVILHCDDSSDDASEDVAPLPSSSVPLVPGPQLLSRLDSATSSVDSFANNANLFGIRRRNQVHRTSRVSDVLLKNKEASTVPTGDLPTGKNISRNSFHGSCIHFSHAGYYVFFAFVLVWVGCAILIGIIFSIWYFGDAGFRPSVTHFVLDQLGAGG